MIYIMIFLLFIHSSNRYFHELGLEGIVVNKAIMVSWSLVREDINIKLPI